MISLVTFTLMLGMVRWTIRAEVERGSLAHHDEVRFDEATSDTWRVTDLQDLAEITEESAEELEAMIRAGAVREADRRDARWQARREALSMLTHVETRIDQGRELRVMRVEATGRHRVLPLIPWLHGALSLASERVALPPLPWERAWGPEDEAPQRGLSRRELRARTNSARRTALGGV